jgi:hypothetical protein
MTAVEVLDPSRAWSVDSVRRHVTKLRELGLVRRVTKRNVGKPATYMRSDGRERPTINDKSLVQVIR